MKQICPGCHGVISAHASKFERVLATHREVCPAAGTPRTTRKKEEEHE